MYGFYITNHTQIKENQRFTINKKIMKKEKLKKLDRVITTLVKCAEQVKDLINEPEKYTPRKGDFIYNKWGEYRYIDIYKNEKDFFASFKIEPKVLTLKPSVVIYSMCSIIRPATEEEKKLLLDALHEKGKDWDFEKMEIVDYRWRAEIGGKYWYLDSFGDVDYSIEEYDRLDTCRFNFGNYFKTKKKRKHTDNIV